MLVVSVGSMRSGALFAPRMLYSDWANVEVTATKSSQLKQQKSRINVCIIRILQATGKVYPCFSDVPALLGTSKKFPGILHRKTQVIWRIDYHLATPALAAGARSEAIYKGEKFSDHAPITIDYELRL